MIRLSKEEYDKLKAKRPRGATLLYMNRALRVPTLAGHVLIFKKGIPQWVPDVVVEDCMKVGATVPEDDDFADFVPPKARREARLKDVLGDERRNGVREAVLEVIDRNDPHSFTAAGLPTLKALSTLAGFEVQGTDRDAIWGEVKQLIKAGLSAEEIREGKTLEDIAEDINDMPQGDDPPPFYGGEETEEPLQEA